MRLTDRCEDQFPRGVVDLGRRLFKRGQINLFHADRYDALGEVKNASGVPFEVQVSFEFVSEQALPVFCECHTFKVSGPCMHLWAFLLHLDQTKHGAAVPGTSPLSLMVLDPDEATERHAESEDDAPAPPRGNWRAQMAVIDAKALLGGAPPSRELFLVTELSKVEEKKGALLRFHCRDWLPSGELDKLKPIPIGPADFGTFDDTDQSLLSMLFGLLDRDSSTPSYSYSYRTAYRDRDRHRSAWLSIKLFEVALPWLCRSEKLIYVDKETREAKPISYDPEPWTYKLQGIETEDGLRIEGRFTESGGRSLCLDGSTVTFLPEGWILFPDHVARFEDPKRTFGWIRSLADNGSLRIPESEESEALERIWSHQDGPEIELPERFETEVEILEPTPRLNIRFDVYHSQFFAEPSFIYGDKDLEPNSETVQWMEAGLILRRNSEVEAKRMAELKDLAPDLVTESIPGPISYLPNGEARIAPPHLRFTGKTKQFAAISRRLFELGWQLFAEHRPIRSGTGFSMSVKSDIDWFDVSAAADFGETSADLPSLLAAVRDQSRFVQLDDGSLGILPEEWLKRLGPMAEVLSREELKAALQNKKSGQGESVRFENRRALLLDALLAAGSEVDYDETFQELRRRIRSFGELEAMNAPDTFQGELRPYQELGLSWMDWLAELGLGGCLADDMGLGKTVQVLALLERRRLAGSLDDHWSVLVVPRSLLHNWVREGRRFTPQLPMHIHHGPARKKELTALREEGRPQVLVTTYGTLLRDLESLRELPVDVLVLDEAQAIKNAKSQTAKACRAMPARRRLALTGTPIENHLGELWSLFEFLNPGMLGALPSMASMVGRLNLSEDALDVVAQAIRPLVLRRTKEEVLTDLPPKTEQTLVCDLSTAERKRYDELLRHYRSQLGATLQSVGMKRSKMQVLEALLRLRQAACHGGLMDKKLMKQSSSKLDVLLERVREVADEGHKALVFSQFTKFLSIVRKQLDKEKIVYEYLDGRTRNRDEKVERFQNDPDCSLFLISLKAGGVGLNLTAASYIFLLDPWWNPAVEAQAVDRAHRIGQEKPVFAYRLIARDTVEEKILLMQEQKKALADAVIAQDKRVLGRMTADDLELLLGGPLI